MGKRLLKNRMLKQATAVILSIVVTATGVDVKTLFDCISQDQDVVRTEIQAKEVKKETEKEPSVVKELKDLRTADSSTYLLSNGFKRVEYYSDNVRYEKDGKYVEYKPELKKTGVKEGYAYTNTSGDSNHYFSEILNESGILLEKDSYQIRFVPECPKTENEDETSEERKNASDQKEDKNFTIKEVKGTDITYKDESGNVEYNYVSNHDGVKEEIVLNKMPESNIFTFYFKTNGMEMSVTEYDNTIRIYDKKTGKQTAYIDEPNIRDKSSRLSYSDVKYELEKTSDSEYEIRVIADKEYLEKADYPVIIDPTVVWLDSYIPTAAITNMPYMVGSNLKNTTNMEVLNKCNNFGPYAGTEKYCYIDTTGVLSGNAIAGHPQHLEDMYIENATLRLTEYETNGFYSQQGLVCAYTTGTVEVRAVNGEWSADTVTWNNHPDMGNKVWAQFQCTGVKYIQHNIDLTDWARAVVSGEIGNYGIALRAKEENTGETFYSERHNIVTVGEGDTWKYHKRLYLRLHGKYCHAKRRQCYHIIYI